MIDSTRSFTSASVEIESFSITTLLHPALTNTLARRVLVITLLADHWSAYTLTGLWVLIIVRVEADNVVLAFA